ncbi:LegC family aminotransferase [Ruminococcaceae bacterium OttesenSCG-928-A16]|nr:LegC family aminotransferase [Ruminococcaceae bacterium OttesenSCG-928-A16]
MNETFIPLSVPNFSGNEKEYVNDAVVSEWVSSGGSKVADFEEKLAAYVHMPRAVACNSGTSGLHLALICAGVQPGQEVLAPALTFIAAVNPIRYVFAQPVFIGCDDTLCMDPDALEAFCRNNCEVRDNKLYNKATGKQVAAVMVVHVFGNMAAMARIMQIAQQYHLVVIEDATEALGTYYTEGPYKGKFAGTIGDVGVYSFNGNKIITTGSGGMLVTSHPEWAEHAKHLSTQAKTDELQFCHDEVGYNYRLTNLQAALGLAQLEQLEGFIAHKMELYNLYHEALNGKYGLRILPFQKDIRANHWFFSLYLEDYPLERDELIAALAAQKIQTRPVWALINQQPPYANCEAYGMQKAEDYRAKIVNIPCSTNLPLLQAQRVINAIIALAK